MTGTLSDLAAAGGNIIGTYFVDASGRYGCVVATPVGRRHTPWGESWARLWTPAPESALARRALLLYGAGAEHWDPVAPTSEVRVVAHEGLTPIDAGVYESAKTRGWKLTAVPPMGCRFLALDRDGDPVFGTITDPLDEYSSAQLAELRKRVHSPADGHLTGVERLERHYAPQTPHNRRAEIHTALDPEGTFADYDDRQVALVLTDAEFADARRRGWAWAHVVPFTARVAEVHYLNELRRSRSEWPDRGAFRAFVASNVGEARFEQYEAASEAMVAAGARATLALAIGVDGVIQLFGEAESGDKRSHRRERATPARRSASCS